MALMEYIVGIDEAGRGPIAGPVAVGGVLIRADFVELPPAMRGSLKDSKKLSATRREEVYAWVVAHNEITWAVSMSSSNVIDSRGIVPAINTAMSRVLRQCGGRTAKCMVKLDGALHAPEEYAQETIIKGDETELAIALASVMAKVTRDRYMEKINRVYPQYGFAQHKGYGTKAHYEVLQKYGLCKIHRVSFCESSGSGG